MSKETPKEFDVFKESLKLVIASDLKTAHSHKLQDGNMILTEKNMTLPQAENWAQLEDAMVHGHSKRFNDVLNNLPDREFARFFVKLMPFFKEKAKRMPLEGDKTLQQINITVHKTGEEVNTKTITIE